MAMLSDGLVIPLPRSQRRYLDLKRPSPLRTTSCPSSPTTATSLVPSPDSFKSTLTDVSYKFPHPPVVAPFDLDLLHFVLAPLPPRVSHLHIQACVRGLARCHLRCRRQTTGPRSHLLGSIRAKQSLSRLLSPSTTVFSSSFPV